MRDSFLIIIQLPVLVGKLKKLPRDTARVVTRNQDIDCLELLRALPDRYLPVLRYQGDHTECVLGGV